jgi:hypothetical protein
VAEIQNWLVCYRFFHYHVLHEEMVLLYIMIILGTLIMHPFKIVATGEAAKVRNSQRTESSTLS